MQNIANKHVNVSDMATYLFCPRLAFFRYGHEKELTVSEIRADIVKSLSGCYREALSSSTPSSMLGSAIGSACSDAVIIYGACYKEHIDIIEAEMKARATCIISGLQSERKRLGECRLSVWLSPASAGVAIHSDRLRLSGVIDRVVRIDDKLAPVVISASAPPPNGIYASDRVRMAAYAMLLSEKYDIDVAHGAIEYALEWRIRETEIRYQDKRKALYVKNRLIEAREGKMPDPNRGKWCEHCDFSQACNIKASLLDSLFKKRSVDLH